MMIQLKKTYLDGKSSIACSGHHQIKAIKARDLPRDVFFKGRKMTEIFRWEVGAVEDALTCGRYSVFQNQSGRTVAQSHTPACRAAPEHQIANVDIYLNSIPVTYLPTSHKGTIKYS